jgi:hypothetical protein
MGYMSNYPDGLSDLTAGAPWAAQKETIDLELVQEAIDTAGHLEELCESDDALNHLLPNIKMIITILGLIKIDNDGGPS